MQVLREKVILYSINEEKPGIRLGWIIQELIWTLMAKHRVIREYLNEKL